jgi:MerR family transcriptional regulator, light-induced transcriptional regulator
MKTFSIAELEQYTLLKTHTLRIWEQRFGIIKPNRTKSNIRYYSVEELAFLLDLSLLSRHGYKISLLASFDRATTKQRVHELKEDGARLEQKLNELIVCMFSLNIEDFELTVDSAIASWGIDRTVEELILPFLKRIQLYSFKDRTTIEYHFVTTVLRKKLILAIEQTNARESIFKSVLLFLPEGEHYDLLLLYLNYHLQKMGVNVLYLGTNISSQNLQQVIQKKKPHVVVGYIADHSKALKKDFSTSLSASFGTSYLLTGAAAFAPVVLPKQTKYIPYQEAAKEVLSLAVEPYPFEKSNKNYQQVIS